MGASMGIVDWPIIVRVMDAVSVTLPANAAADGDEMMLRLMMGKMMKIGQFPWSNRCYI